MPKNRQNQPLPLDEFMQRFPQVSNRAKTAARVLLGAGRENLVEEVVNDVLLLLWRRQRDGKLPEKPEAWAYRVAWNRAAKVARLEGRYAAGLLDEEQLEGTSGYMPMPPSTVTPATGAELQDRLVAVRKLLEAFDSAASTQLYGRDALLFKLRYEKHMSVDEVAQHLGVTPEVVRQQWSRLLTRVLNSVRAELQTDPLCSDLLSTVLANETTGRRTLLEFLRLAMSKGVAELEKLVKASLDN